MDAAGSEQQYTALLEEIRAKTESSSCGKLQLRLYDGPAGLHIVVQESQLTNPDLVDEHWTDVWSKELFHKQRVTVRAMREDMTVVLVVVAGDKAAGKTTFFAGLTGGSIRILQALRYSHAAFFNIWYSPDLGDLQQLAHDPERLKAFFQTALAHGYLQLPTSELAFFCEDEELLSDDDEGPAIIPQPEDRPHALVNLLELGGDFLQDLISLQESTEEVTTGETADSVKDGILKNALQYLRNCARLAYFVNLERLFIPKDTTLAVSEEAVRQTVLHLNFLAGVLPFDACIILYCSKHPRTQHFQPGWLSGPLAALVAAEPDLCVSVDAARAAEWEGLDNPLLYCMQWFLGEVRSKRGWPVNFGSKAYATAHLDDGGEYDYEAILRTLHRLIRNSGTVTFNNIGLVAQQTVNAVYGHFEESRVPGRLRWATKAVLLEALDESEPDDKAMEEDTPSLDVVLHPMCRLPPMVLIDSFAEVSGLLVGCKLALPLHDAQYANICVEFRPEHGAPLIWQPPGPGLGIDGFRLPMFPLAARLVRNGIDLMSSVPGEQLAQITAQIRHLFPSISQQITCALAAAVCKADTEGPADWFSDAVWLVEEWLLVHLLAAAAESSTVLELSRTIDISATRLAQLAERCANRKTQPKCPPPYATCRVPLHVT
eukprot:TRINITY_DN27883_c0_g1_i1.p1 TRINITY_DN27883_c0_g1~~TRINITY_DN27883_c0_g1_i1.p1  ORF type:complete len:665 (+),score=127.13 TRINITY_DN27883_c0_g1_i1:23-1996(+)